MKSLSDSTLQGAVGRLKTGLRCGNMGNSWAKKHIFPGLQLDETDKGSWKKYKIHEIHFNKHVSISYVYLIKIMVCLVGWLVGCLFVCSFVCLFACLCLCPICTCAAFCKISSTTAESNLRLDTLVTCRA